MLIFVELLADFGVAVGAQVCTVVSVSDARVST